MCRGHERGLYVLTADAKVAENVVRDKVVDLVQLRLFGAVLGVHLVETVQPETLEELLGSEESANEAGDMLAEIAS